MKNSLNQNSLYCLMPVFCAHAYVSVLQIKPGSHSQLTRSGQYTMHAYVSSAWPAA